MQSLAKTKPSSDTFDPFSDRRSRDIRNQLSKAFVDAIQTMDPTIFEGVAGNIIADHPVGIYKDYTTARLTVYRCAFDQISKSGLLTHRQQVPILWNHGLFFELHELLEGIWHKSKGPFRQGMKGLIQAAGVYVHLEQGNRKAANGLAQRALRHLEEAGDCLGFIDGIAEIVKRLHRLDLNPPCLGMIKD